MEDTTKRGGLRVTDPRSGEGGQRSGRFALSEFLAANQHSHVGLILGLVLVVLVLATFLTGTQNGFLTYDDPDYVTANYVVQRGLTGEGFAWAFHSIAAANWHPLTWVSHMLDCQFFGLQPAGHHLTSIIIHAITVALVFMTLRRLTGASGRSFLAAALFGLHPLRVESVAWVAERKDVLSGLFAVMTIIAYARYCGESKVQGPKSKVWYGMALLCFALGLMSKPMLVTLPFVLGLLDWWPLGRVPGSEFRVPGRDTSPCPPPPATPHPAPSQIEEKTNDHRDGDRTRSRDGCATSPGGWRGWFMEKLPFLALSLVSCVVTMVAQSHGGAVNEGTSQLFRLENAMVAYARYLGMIFWPTSLAFHYPRPQSWPIETVVGAGVLLVVISAAAFWLRRRGPAVWMGWLWFTGMLVPVIGLVQVGQQAMADRYTYLPSLGIIVATVWGLPALAGNRRNVSAALGVLGWLATAACAVLTRQQLPVWRDTESLCRQALAHTRDNHVAHVMLGAALTERGELEAALHEHHAALAIKPDYAEAHSYLGVTLMKLNRLPEAVQSYERALHLRPSYADAHYNLGLARFALGETEAAIACYRRALEIRADHADAYYNLGVALNRMGKLEEAIGAFRRAIAINPAAADAHNNLGVALDRIGQTDAAIAHYQQAIAVRPDYPRAYFNIGVALARKGRTGDAIVAFQEALRLKPDYAEARTNLLSLQQASGAPAEVPKPQR